MPLDFDAIANETAAEVTAQEVDPSIEVWVTICYEDEHGRELPPYRTEMSPTVKVEGLGSGQPAQDFALSLYRGTISDNIKALIRSQQPGFNVIKGGPDYPVRVKSIEVEYAAR